MRRWSVALIGVFLLAAGLSGCTLLAGKPVTPKLTRPQQELYSMRSWTMEGRLGVKAGTEGWTANLFWEHDEGQDRLRLFGPFGQGAVSIVLQKDVIYINEGKGLTEASRNPEQSLKNRLGFFVPVNSLRYWMIGLPAPGVEYAAIWDASGGLKGFEQQGWRINFESFDAVGNFVLPRKMSVRGNEVLLKLVADEWVLKK